MRLRLSPVWNRIREKCVSTFGSLSRLFEGRVPHGHLAPQDLLRARRIPLLVFSVTLSVCISWVIVSRGPKTRKLPLLQVGEVADQTLLSPLTAEIEPKALPQKTRNELHRKVAPVFDYDDTIVQTWLQNWSTVFSTVRSKFFGSESAKVASQMQLMDRIGEFIQKATGQTLNPSDLLYLTQNRFSKQLEEAFAELAKPLLGRLIAQTDLFPSYYATGIIVRQISLGLNETPVNDVSRIWSVDHARQLINHVLNNSPKKKREAMQHIAGIVQHLVVPNLRFNPELTERRLNNALGKRSGQIIPIRRGQEIIHIGERITETHAEIVEALRELTSSRTVFKRFFVVTLIFSVFFFILFHLDLTRRSFLRLPLKNALVFGAITLSTLLGMKLFYPYLHSLLSAIYVTHGAEYLIPVATGAILIQLLLGRELSYTYSLVLSLSAAFLLDKSLTYGIWVFCVATTAVQSLGACKQRTDLYKCGAWSGLVGALLALLFDLGGSLALQSFDLFGITARCLMAFFSGLFGSIVASTFIPILEALLGYTTNLKLLELSNFNHPLLHNLMMKAPGTYHHSIMVGSLAEIAADRIKANSLLARVSAYYHDIGKMANPLYFIENQSPQYNPHDHLSPSISARILFSHVKNGARMGREHGLGESINDIIQQHHGTTLTTFFFNKAKEQENPAESTVSESDFRYPGPRPQTRESAIVMIADACEASTRSIPDPTPVKIQSMVHNIINKRFLDQQFHDCDLTLKDLQIIEDCISKTLLSLYHHRIEYPGQRQALGEPTSEMPRKLTP